MKNRKQQTKKEGDSGGSRTNPDAETSTHDLTEITGESVKDRKKASKAARYRGSLRKGTSLSKVNNTSDTALPPEKEKGTNITSSAINPAIQAELDQNEIEFWAAVETLKSATSKNRRQAQMNRIYKKYIYRQSPQRVKLPRAVERRIQKERSLEAFVHAQEEIIRVAEMLTQDPLSLEDFLSVGPSASTTLTPSTNVSPSNSLQPPTSGPVLTASNNNQISALKRTSLSSNSTEVLTL
eukprot:Awhi_evm1s561